jgi:fatty-acid desaturase
MLGGSSLVDRWPWQATVVNSQRTVRVKRRILTGILAFHVLALLACAPWLFSWSGLVWVLGGLYVFGTLGINIGYHRLLTHRGFACPRWLEHTLSLLGICCSQGSPMSWVAIHRMHHQHSDQPSDPHSPRGSFFWSHLGWFLVYDSALYDLSTYGRYAPDLLRDRFYRRLEHPRVWAAIQLAQWLAFFGTGGLVGALGTWTLSGALQFGLSWLVWGVFVRTVAVWHMTWSVNSITHLWGYRSFDTPDDSRNNWLVALVSNGEGWHNNHHADPRCAAHGWRWWELDVSYLTIRGLKRVGLASDLVKRSRGAAPRSRRDDARCRQTD